MLLTTTCLSLCWLATLKSASHSFSSDTPRTNSKDRRTLRSELNSQHTMSRFRTYSFERRSGTRPDKSATELLRILIIARLSVSFLSMIYLAERHSSQLASGFKKYVTMLMRKLQSFWLEIRVILREIVRSAQLKHPNLPSNNVSITFHELI